MPTYLYTKKQFIAFLEEHVHNDRVVMFSNDLHGSLSISKKGLKVPAIFSSDVFKDLDLTHIFSGRSIPLNILITQEEVLSDVANNYLKKIKTKEDGV